MTTFKGSYAKYMNAGIALWDDISIGFGSEAWATEGENASPDFEIYWDSTNTRLNILPHADDAKMRFGDMAGIGTDVQFSGSSSANYAEWDSSSNALEFNGAGGIVMGAGTVVETASTGAIKGSDFLIPFVFSATDGGEVISNSGVLQAKFQAPFAMTITEVCLAHHGAITTGDSASLSVNVLEGGTTILTGSKLECVATETNVVAAPAAGAIYDNAQITVEITADAGGSIAANSGDNASMTVILTAKRA